MPTLFMQFLIFSNTILVGALIWSIWRFIMAYLSLRPKYIKKQVEKRIAKHYAERRRYRQNQQKSKIISIFDADIPQSTVEDAAVAEREQQKSQSNIFENEKLQKSEQNIFDDENLQQGSSTLNSTKEIQSEQK
uniref:Uncharacterized protein n=1 Tax=Panagrolaimus davidi TaxID=227884 RepID=A0A914Q3G5_9BILA